MSLFSGLAGIVQSSAVGIGGQFFRNRGVELQLQEAEKRRLFDAEEAEKNRWFQFLSQLAMRKIDRETSVELKEYDRESAFQLKEFERDTALLLKRADLAVAEERLRREEAAKWPHGIQPEEFLASAFKPVCDPVIVVDKTFVQDSNAYERQTANPVPEFFELFGKAVSDLQDDGEMSLCDFEAGFESTGAARIWFNKAMGARAGLLVWTTWDGRALRVHALFQNLTATQLWQQAMGQKRDPKYKLLGTFRGSISEEYAESDISGRANSHASTNRQQRYDREDLTYLYALLASTTALALVDNYMTLIRGSAYSPRLETLLTPRYHDMLDHLAKLDSADELALVIDTHRKSLTQLRDEFDPMRRQWLRAINLGDIRGPEGDSIHA